MEQLEMKIYRKKNSVELIAVVEDGYLVQNQGNDSDQWTILKEVFESTYEEVV